MHPRTGTVDNTVSSRSQDAYADEVEFAGCVTREDLATEYLTEIYLKGRNLKGEIGTIDK